MTERPNVEFPPDPWRETRALLADIRDGAKERLQVRVALARHDLDRRLETTLMRVCMRLPSRVVRTCIVVAAVRATTPPAIAVDEYAGPDGLDYERLMEHA